MNAYAYTKEFPEADSSIHELAVAKLMYGSKSWIRLSQTKYAYEVSGGSSGSLSYSKGSSNHWATIASWGFWGAYLEIRYRHAQWLRPMYEILFSYLNYSRVEFEENILIVSDNEGRTISGRTLRLVKPGAMETALTQRFGFSGESLERLRLKFPELF